MEPTKPEYTGCLNCEDFIVPLGSKPCKGCAENNHENFRPKQEKEPTEFTGCDQCQFKTVPGNRLPCKGCKTNNYVNFRPMKKEKEMKEYKITKTTTIRNVAQTTLDTNCKDAMIKFIEYITGASRNGYFENVDNNVDKSSRLFKHLTKSDKSTLWGIEHGFIEESVSLKRCPFCGGEIGVGKDNCDEYYWECPVCETECKGFETKKMAVTHLNKRKS